LVATSALLSRGPWSPSETALRWVDVGRRPRWRSSPIRPHGNRRPPAASCGREDGASVSERGGCPRKWRCDHPGIVSSSKITVPVGRRWSWADGRPGSIARMALIRLATLAEFLRLAWSRRVDRVSPCRVVPRLDHKRGWRRSSGQLAKKGLKLGAGSRPPSRRSDDRLRSPWWKMDEGAELCCPKRHGRRS